MSFEHKIAMASFLSDSLQALGFKPNKPLVVVTPGGTAATHTVIQGHSGVAVPPSVSAPAGVPRVLVLGALAAGGYLIYRHYRRTS